MPRRTADSRKGDTIPIKRLEALWLGRKLLDKPVRAADPIRCATAEEKASAGPETNAWWGAADFGKFKFLALLDLDWEKEMELVCPINFGQVTIYQTSRHGSFDDAGSPAMLGAIRPQVVVMNNGPRKGMGQTDH
jgi:hypothetical protein